MSRKLLSVVFAPILALLLFNVAATARAQGGPPMLTDDPGTPGRGMWEVNFLSTMNHSSEGWTFDAPNVDLNYGLGNHIQLKFETPWVITKEKGKAARSGLGNSMVGVKWRFLDEETNNVNMSIYPQLEFNSPTRSVERGLAEKGVRLFLPVEVSRKVGPLELDGEIGYRIVAGGHNEWEYGFVVARQVRPHF